MGTKIEQLKKLLVGEDGKLRNGISIGRVGAMRIFDGDYFTAVKSHPAIQRFTLACVEGYFSWLELEQVGINMTKDLSEQVSEETAGYLLRYGRIEEGAGKV